MLLKKEVKVAWKHQRVELHYYAVQSTTTSFFWHLQVSLLTEHVSGFKAQSRCLSCAGWMCLHPLFAAVMRACVQSQFVLIPASMCHRECRRLASIKAANRRSCAGAASEFSTPLPSVIGHTQRRTKRAEAGTDWREERVGSKGQKMEKQRLNHYR